MKHYLRDNLFKFKSVEEAIYNYFVLTIKNECSITVYNCIDGKDYASNDNMELVLLMADIYKLIFNWLTPLMQ